MEAMVTARIPVEIKEQGNAILKEIGATATQLVNAAYEYLLATRELPVVHASVSGKRKLSEGQRADLQAFFNASSIDAPDSFWEVLGERDYRDLAAEWRLRDYEALS